MRWVSSARHFSLNSVPIGKTRNIGVIAHIDAGKTTTTERILFYSGRTKRIGNVDQGDTVTDYLAAERARGITIQLAAVSVPWNGHKINVIDTPGHADFTFEVIRSLRVLDGAVTILDAVAGVEAQTEKVWRQAKALGIPRIAYVNKMDRPGAGFSRTVKEIVAKLQTRVVCLNLPHFEQRGLEHVFCGVLDVLHKKRLVWDQGDDTGTTLSAVELSAEQEEVVRQSRASMVETLGDIDESVIESFFEHNEDYMAVPAELLAAALRRATIANKVTPVLCGLSFRNIGVQPLIDAVVALLPSPLETPLPELTGKGKVSLAREKSGLVINNNAHLTVALAFKVITHPVRGVMAFFRVYAGRLASNSTVVNTRTGKRLRLRKLMLMHSDVPEDVSHVAAGNIGVVGGTEDDIVTGDTLVSHGSSGLKAFGAVELSLRLHPIETPPPLFNASIEPATAGDERHMKLCIDVLRREDPSLHVSADDELGQTVLSGMGELHLEITKDRLLDMKVNARLRDVAVAYKETVLRPGAVEVGAFSNTLVRAAVTIAPLDEPGAVHGNTVVVAEGATPPHIAEAIEGRRWKLEETPEEALAMLVLGCHTGLSVGGVLFGLPLHSCVVTVTLWDFPVESTDVPAGLLLEVGRRAVVAAVAQLNETPNSIGLLEPIMTTRIQCGSDAVGNVVHDLNNRCQATILSVDDECDTLETQKWAQQEAERVYLPPDYTIRKGDEAITSGKVVVAETPLREMVGYLSVLRSLTQGRGSFDMTFLGMRRALRDRIAQIRRGWMGNE